MSIFTKHCRGNFNLLPKSVVEALRTDKTDLLFDALMDTRKGGNLDTINQFAAIVSMMTLDTWPDKWMSEQISKLPCRLMEVALDCGADANFREGAGHSLLSAAAFHERLDMVDLLLGRGAEIIDQQRGPQPLGCAIGKNSVPILKRLLDEGVEINDPKWPVWFSALDYGAHDCLKLLFDRGADIHARSAGGYTGLHYLVEVHLEASDHEDTRMGDFEDRLVFLLDRRVDVNARDESGRTAEDLALMEDRPDMAEEIRRQAAISHALYLSERTPSLAKTAVRLRL